MPEDEDDGDELVALGLVAPYPAIPDGRTRDHGTATSFSPPRLNELVVEDAEGEVEDEGVVDDALDGVVEDGVDGVVEEVDGVVLLLGLLLLVLG